MGPEIRRFWIGITLFVPFLLLYVFFYVTSTVNERLIGLGGFLLMVGIFWAQQYRISKLKDRLSLTEKGKS
jgi:hypothetical protein